MLALSWGVEEEEKAGGMSRVDRAKSGAGAGRNAAMCVLRRTADSKADGGGVPVLCLVAGADFASESKFQNFEGGEEKAEMSVNGCRLVVCGVGLCPRLEIEAFAGVWLWISSCLLAIPTSCWQILSNPTFFVE